tara:strand:+ start:147 stop:626 length:480 start_codon:yes stop_codon:yes gene_type:complete
MKLFLPLLLTVLALGCRHEHAHDHDHGHHHHGVEGHSHAAPHGGVMVDVENEFCHLEFVIDPGNGRLQMHALRFHPREEPVKFFMEQVEATAKIGDEEKAFVFRPTQADGETPATEATSLYTAELDWLKETPAFDGTVKQLEIEGRSLQNITFKFAKKD